MQRRVAGHSMLPDHAGACRRDGRRVIWAPVATDWRAIWPTTCDGSVKAPGRIAVRLSRDRAQLIGRDLGRERDVLGRDDDRPGRGRRRRRRAAAAAATAGEEQDARRRRRSPGRPRRAGRGDSSASSWFSPRRMRCDRWHHSSTAQRRRDYTKGLGPLGGKDRKSCTPQGSLQGCGSVPLVARPATTRWVVRGGTKKTAAGPEGPTAAD